MEPDLSGPGWRCLWDAQCDLGEGPIWDARAGLVRFVDINGARVYRLDMLTGARASWTAPCRVGSIGIRAGGGLIAGTQLGFAVVDPDTCTFKVIVHPEADRPTNRFNDGKVDPHGNFWAGTMDERRRDRSGVLYCLRADRTWAAIDLGYRITNGPAFSPDGTILYHTDTMDGTTFAFPLAPDGTVGARRVFRTWHDVGGHPDGMTTDAAGHLWIAFWGGGCVRRVAPTGEVVGEFALPVSNVSSVAFGGPGLDRLFATSARQDLTPAAIAAQPLAGGLFEVLGHGVTGLPGGIYRG
jgi:D-xylonolactonase